MVEDLTVFRVKKETKKGKDHFLLSHCRQKVLFLLGPYLQFGGKNIEFVDVE